MKHPSHNAAAAAVLFSAPQPERRIRMQIQQHTPESNQAALSNFRLCVFCISSRRFHVLREGDANEAVAQEQHQVLGNREKERCGDNVRSFWQERSLFKSRNFESGNFLYNSVAHVVEEFG
jgi:hypothetical protein